MASTGKVGRRFLLGGTVGAAGLGLAAYKAIPSMFWKQLSDDLSRDVNAAPLKPDPSKWPDTGVHAAWLGHSSVLLKIDGYTLVTDPVLNKWIGVDLRVATVGMKRLVAPALAAKELPKVDLILSSHAHMDHLDLATMRELEQPNTSVIMAKSTSDLIRSGGYREIREIGWGERTQIGPLSIKALEVKHRGARMRTDTYRGYNGYVIESGKWRILFAGDTADTHTFQAQRNGNVDLAIFPIGAYNPWVYAHCNPEEAWRMANEFGAEQIMGVHHKTFKLSREAYGEPMERFLTIAGKSASRIVAREIGSEFHLT